MIIEANLFDGFTFFLRFRQKWDICIVGISPSLLVVSDSDHIILLLTVSYSEGCESIIE
jgi:hypothetical protein